MTIWALSDLHLSFSTPNKSMEVFGPLWSGYTEKIETHWRELVSTEDLMLIPGDISWAMRLDEALIDLEWIDKLPGTKLILKGNHDYWWSSASKLSKVMPPTIHFIQNNVFNWKGVSIGGTRLWDSEEYRFNQYVHFQETDVKKSKETPYDLEANRKIFKRELERLRLSLQKLDPQARVRIALTHYPPISADLKPSSTSHILEEFGIKFAIFGHLHSIKKETPLFGEARGIQYLLTSCDYLDFVPLRIL